jgi:hypothetical protein
VLLFSYGGAMNNKQMKITISIMILVSTVFACSLPAISISPTALSGGEQATGITITDTPESITETPMLPFPAMDIPRIAYTKAENVWLWTEGIGTSQLTFDGGAKKPVISSDGLMVAFIRNGELWVVNADGSNEASLVDSTFLTGLIPGGDIVEVNDFVWQPGNHVIYFNTAVITGEAGYHIPQFDLYSFNIDDAGLGIISIESPALGGVPTFSPDGLILALAQPDKIIFLGIEGNTWDEVLTFPFVLTYSESAYVPAVVWNLDSSAARVVIPAHDALAEPDAVTTVWDLPVDGTSTIVDTFVAVPVFAASPLLSSDGTKVLYMAPDGSNNTIQVRQFGGADSGYTYANSGQIGIDSWSPDSINFIYWLPQPSDTFIAAVGYRAYSVSDVGPDANDVQWIDSRRLAYLTSAGELRYRAVDGASVGIDTDVSDFNTGWLIQ